MDSNNLSQRLEKIGSLPFEEIDFLKLSDGLSPDETIELLEMLIAAREKDALQNMETLRENGSLIQFRHDHELDELTITRLNDLLSPPSQ